MDGTFLVFDRVKAPNSTDEKKIYWHFNQNGIPQVSGNITTSAVGSSKLFMKTLLPQSPLIVVQPDPVTDTNSTPATYRTEISDSVASSNLNALNVISVTDNTVSSMIPTSNIISSSGNMTGALIIGTSPKVVMFPPMATRNHQPRMPRVTRLRQASTGRYSSWHIRYYQNSSKILTGVVASAQGVLSFTATSGGTFQIIQTSSSSSVPVISAFIASPSSINYGSSATLSWTTSGATSLPWTTVSVP